MNDINLFTIGFTQKTVQDFFNSIKTSGIKKVIDIRLKNASQLSVFAKMVDLKYFLARIDHLEILL